MGSAARPLTPPQEQKRDPSNLVALFSIGPYERNRITRSEIDRLRNLIDKEGLEKVSKIVKLSQLTLLRICAGFAHRLTTPTAKRLSAYLKH
jgi:hypothetical protein